MVDDSPIFNRGERGVNKTKATNVFMCLLSLELFLNKSNKKFFICPAMQNCWVFICSFFLIRAPPASTFQIKKKCGGKENE